MTWTADIYDSDGNIAICNAEGTDIAYMVNYDLLGHDSSSCSDEAVLPTQSEQHVNATLMAAAPKLLAALIRLRDCPDVQMESTEEETDAARRQANDAIDTARGLEDFRLALQNVLKSEKE